MKRSLLLVVVLSFVALLLIGATTLGFKKEGFSDISTGGTFTMYYADWCGACKASMPDFKQFMGNGTVTVNGKPVTVRMISPEKEPEKMGSIQVKGYPTFIYAAPSGKTSEYNGPRTPDAFKQFLQENVLSS